MNANESDDRCVAPVGDAGELCGATPTGVRVVEGLECPLCAAHAAEVDAEAARYGRRVVVEHGGELSLHDYVHAHAATLTDEDVEALDALAVGHAYRSETAPACGRVK